MTGSDFSKLPGSENNVADITDFSLIDSSTGDEFKFESEESTVKFNIGANFEDPNNSGTVEPAEGKEFECVFWDIANETWSTEGCTFGGFTDGTGYCSCNHLTSFSI